MVMKSIEKKNVQYESVRALAAIAVIIIHTFNSAILLFGEDASIAKVIIYRCIMNSMWWAVPCFVMLSGTLLLNSDKKISLKKLYGKYIFRMLVVLFVFGTGFAWLELFFESRTVNIREIVFAFKNMLLGNTWSHMWYVYCLVCLYLLLPLFKIIADYASDKELKYILCILLAIGTVLQLLKDLDVDFVWAGYLHINTIYPFWFLLGAAHNRGILSMKKGTTVLIFCVVSAVLIAASIVEEVMSVSLKAFWGYGSIIVVFQAITLYKLLIKTNAFNKFVSKILLEIADKSFGIYIVHMIFINFVYKVLKFNPFDTSSGIISGFILVFANLIISFVIASIMRKIPIIKKYI